VEWWQELFASPAWQGVQLGWESAEDADEQVDLLVRALRVEPGARILDAPCGTGRIAARLEARGYTTVGIDIEQRFVDEAVAQGLDARQGDVRDQLDNEVFDAAICFWGSFGYFDDTGNLAQARAAADALKPGGRYLIDTHIAETLFPHFRDKNWFDVEDTLVLTETELDGAAGRVVTDWTLIRGVERQTHRSSVRVYTLHEFTDLLREAGFDTFEARDDELHDFELGSSRLWLIATK
jgi:SAM-dependent methyltransferase